MEHTKTLWMLDYRKGGWSHLVPFYAGDEQEAWIEASHWAIQHEMILPEDATMVHFPHGFTLNRYVLPGRDE